MSVELSYMTGPALAVLLVSAISAQATMYAVGAGIVLSGVALFALNPPMHSTPDPANTGLADRDDLQDRPLARREWLRGRLIAVLAVTAATTIVLGGTDVSVVASLREAGQVQWTGAVLAIWGAYSMIGGFVYGTVHRSLSPIALVGLMGALTIPVGLVSGWGWLCLALLPAGALCAPALATTADAVSRLAPPGARGEAMGLHGSALTIGLTLGAPLAGAVIDASSPSSGFLVAGLAGGLVALVVGLLVLQGLHSGRSREQRASEASPPSIMSSTDNSTRERPPGALAPPTEGLDPTFSRKVRTHGTG
jgi:predicted MFS family arabinose efflux permease